MKTDITMLCIKQIVNGVQDKAIIDILRSELRKQLDFDIFLDSLTYKQTENHFFSRRNDSVVVKNLEDMNTTMAVIATGHDENGHKKRLTRQDGRRIKHLFPYPEKWAHLCRVLRHRLTWAEIEEKAGKLCY